jgi:hypothetical protein
VGLYISEQFGDDVVGNIMMFSSKWFQCLIIATCCLTGCCCCGCFCCCFNFCCGKCKPELPDDEDTPDLAEFEGADEEEEGVVTSQPESASEGPTVIAMPPPAYEAATVADGGKLEPTETTALKTGAKGTTNYTDAGEKQEL